MYVSPCRPPIRDFADHGQTELINDDMLSLCDGVRDITNGRKQHWVSPRPAVPLLLVSTDSSTHRHIVHIRLGGVGTHLRLHMEYDPPFYAVLHTRRGRVSLVVIFRCPLNNLVFGCGGRWRTRGVGSSVALPSHDTPSMPITWPAR